MKVRLVEFGEESEVDFKHYDNLAQKKIILRQVMTLLKTSMTRNYSKIKSDRKL